MSATDAKAGLVKSVTQPRTPLVFGVILGAITLLGVLWPFFELRKASLWLDELWTLYFADPSLSLKDVFSQRIVQDLHPPLYYLLMHAWLTVAPDPDFAERLFSSILGVGLIGCVVIVGRRFMSAAALLFMIAMITTGYAYIHFATEARSYMLAFLIGTGQAFAFQQIISDLRGRKSLSIRLVFLFGALSFANSLTHYYGFLYTGSLIGTLTLFAIVERNLRSFALLVGMGLVIFVLVSSYAFWSLKFSRFTIHDNWISGDLKMELRTIRDYAWYAVGGQHGGFLLASAIAGLTAGEYLFGDRAEGRRVLRAVLPHAMAAFGLVILSLIVSKVWAPSITSRNLLISVPSVWLGVALAMDAALQSKRLRTRRTFALLAVLVPLWGMPFIVVAGGANRNEWRASAQFVNSLAACRGKNVPIYGGPRPIEDVRFYSHYLDPKNEITPVPASNASAVFDPNCPVRLWAVMFVDEPPVHKVIADLGARARVVEFPNDVPWDCWLLSCRLFSREKDVAALVVLQEPAR